MVLGPVTVEGHFFSYIVEFPGDSIMVRSADPFESFQLDLCPSTTGATIKLLIGFMDLVVMTGQSKGMRQLREHLKIQGAPRR